MWGHTNKTWLTYKKGLIATNAASAAFLSDYLHHLTINRTYLAALEVIDLQKYKVIKPSRKLKQAINERLKIPFVFLSCNN